MLHRIEAKRIVYTGIFAAVAIVLSIVENMLPSPGFMYGAKIGLANVVTLAAISVFSAKEALLIVLARTFVTSLLTGTFSAYPFSLAGGISAWIIMLIAYKMFYGKLSFAGISLLGAIAHSTAQVMVASVLIGTNKMFAYLMILILISSFTGFFTGVCANLLVPRLKKLKEIKS